ncbi:hypothetical protein GUJ93_ZPchr0004g39517 [Zizania palustris]|uniref:Uncharacterized protein n=1 Tax=Zizania palustris TaxID=103762 RepID=A0A8J5SS29_ZIZPA|nr:hypothetical protein GUJ93_ZPchr0004g39517 [Zizania palustris]
MPESNATPPTLGLPLRKESGRLLGPRAKASDIAMSQEELRPSCVCVMPLLEQSAPCASYKRSCFLSLAPVRRKLEHLGKQSPSHSARRWMQRPSRVRLSEASRATHACSANRQAMASRSSDRVMT